MLRERSVGLSSRLLLAGTVAFLGSVESLQARQPSVRFDSASAIACRVVTPPGPVTLVGSGAKLIEARFRVSILISDGRQEDVEDVFVTLDSPHSRLRVADFSPKTEMANSLEGEVETTRTTEKSTTAGAQIGGGTLPSLYGLATASIGAMQHHVVAQVVKELPSKCLVLASGTTHGEHGVFFKVKGAPQVPLEGAKEFVCVFEVPKDWKADWCLLTCHARGVTQRYMSKKIEPCGHAETFVGLYLAGDNEGQEVARRLDHLQLSQVADRAERQALGLPRNDEQATETNHHRSFEFPATRTSWSKRPGLFEHRTGSSASHEDQLCVALRLTLDELGSMAGR